ncbi:MAG: dihydroorotase [Salibacteraceae bacterium]
MKRLFKRVKIVYPGHRLHGAELDILLDDGRLIAASSDIEDSAADKTYSAKEIIALPGLVDMQCSAGQPGMEHKEDLDSVRAAARSGGFFHIVLLPDTHPPVDHGSEVESRLKVNGTHSVKIHTYGTISKGLKGSELSEMYDMWKCGALGFTDAYHSVGNPSLMRRALDYVKSFGGLIVSAPDDDSLSPGGMVNESAFTMRLGLKSKPPLAEEVMLHRDIQLLKYTQSKLHIAAISTKGSVKIIETAKSEKLPITAGVALANLVYTEHELESFDSNFKVLPFLRGEQDRTSLVKALQNATLDVIVTNHRPENIEEKDREFDHAAFGMTMLETAIPIICDQLADSVGWDTLAEKMSLNPRKILGIDAPEVVEGELFEFTLVDPRAKWRYDESTIQSKSQNSPLFGSELTGRAINWF